MKHDKLFILLFLLGTLALGIVVGCTAGVAKYDSLAKCLSANNAIMYGTTWCPHCQDQKKAFGDSFQYVTFVDCDKNAADCNTAGITGYPTWIINGTKYMGVQNFYDLARNSGCLATLENSTNAAAN